MAKLSTAILSILFVSSIAFTQAHAQSIQLSGVIQDTGNTPVSYASVSLLRHDAVSKVKLSDEDGRFLIEDITSGEYTLRVSVVGYRLLEMPLNITETHDLGVLRLEQDATTLDEVTVTATRKVLDRQADRFVMDVGASSFQTSSLLEIFMAAPFMQVKGEQISINGRSNILVLVDNVPVPGATLSQVLNTMNGNEIDKIDFITTPGARYDASVSAVINIKTKRAMTQGLTGTLNGAYSRGDRGRGNTGINLTYRKNRWTLNGRYSFTRNDWETSVRNDREITLANRSFAIGGPNAVFNDYRIHNAKVSAGFEISPVHQITLTANMSHNTSPNGRSSSTAYFSPAIQAMPDSVLVAASTTTNTTEFENYSLNYVGTLGNPGSKTELIITYTPVGSSRYRETTLQEMRTIDGVLQSALPIVRNQDRSAGHIFLVQSDWELSFQGDWLLETGLRLNSARNNFGINQSGRINGIWEPMSDYTFTNKFYEDVFAGYATLQKKINSTQLRVGLRAEHTRMGVEEAYNRRLLDFFPDFLIQQEIADGHTVSVNYRRTIARPGFGSMTPFRTYINEYEISEGNPNLRPSYSQIFTLNGNVVENLFLELEYLQYRDRLMQLPRQEGEVSVWAPLTMDGSEWSANLSYSLKIAPWWDASSYVRGFRYAYSGALNDDYVDESGYSYSLGLSSTLRLPAGFVLDATFNYDAPSGYVGWYDFSFNFARLALRKSFLDKRAQVVLAFNDIFQGQRYRSELSAGNLYIYNVNYNDSQRISLGFVFNFGKTTVKAAQEKKTGAEDILNRAN